MRKRIIKTTLQENVWEKMTNSQKIMCLKKVLEKYPEKHINKIKLLKLIENYSNEI